MKRFYLPENCEVILRDLIDKHISTKNKEKSFHKFAYVLHLLFHYRTMFPKEYEEKGKRINAAEIKKLLNDDREEKVLLNLKKWELIKIIGGFIPGEKSYSYKLHPQLEEDRIKILPVGESEAAFIKKLKTQTRKELSKEEVVRTQLKILNDKLTLNEDGLKYLREKYQFNSSISTGTCIEPLDMQLLSIHLKDFMCSRSQKENRIHSNFTSLKSDFRKYLLLDGKPLYSLDIVNSQIVFSLPVILDKYRELFPKKSLQTDFLMFWGLVERGKIYDFLAKESGQSNLLEEDRAAFKEQFFKYFWYSKPSETNYKVKVAFKKHFPNIFECIQKIKNPNHEQFPIKMMQEESKVMVDTVYAEALRRGYVGLSLHDGLYFNSMEAVEWATDYTKKIVFERLMEYKLPWESESMGVKISIKKHTETHTGTAS